MNLNNSTTPEAEKDLAQTPSWFKSALDEHLNFKLRLDVCACFEYAKPAIFYGSGKFQNGTNHQNMHKRLTLQSLEPSSLRCPCGLLC